MRNSLKPQHGLCHGDRPRRIRAFTLIEVLVVVAIIALLVAILLPSLKKARDQAKITACKANAQQIAYATNQYQSESKEFVPILYNYFAGFNANNVNAHARNCMLSVALRKYDKGTARMKEIIRAPYTAFDPEDRWPDAKRDEYVNHIMPEHFACPFERAKGNGWGTFSADAKFDYWQWSGRYESYHTWFHDRIMLRNTPVNGTQWPGGPGPDMKGIPQYSSFTFNRKDDPDLQQFFSKNGITIQSEWLQSYLHRRWRVGIGDASTDPTRKNLDKKYQTGSMSEMATVYCAQGEHIQWPQSGGSSRIGRANVGSHMTGRGGGTNVIFADSHVNWVVGTRIGLP